MRVHVGSSNAYAANGRRPRARAWLDSRISTSSTTQFGLARSSSTDMETRVAQRDALEERCMDAGGSVTRHG